VNFTLSLDLTESQRGELAVEAQFYGLLRLMMPYYAQEEIGVALLRRACVTGTKRALRSAVSQARALTVEMGSTTPWLADESQDARFVITDRVVNDMPVWASEDGDAFMFRANDGSLWIGNDQACAEGEEWGWMQNCAHNPESLAPTQLRMDEWQSDVESTLGPQFTSAGGTDEDPWVWVPDMRVAAVHWLDDGHPSMAAALRQLAALRENIGVALLQRACITGTKQALRSAVEQARALTVETESTTPWLADEFLDARFVITDRVVNDMPESVGN